MELRDVEAEELILTGIGKPVVDESGASSIEYAVLLAAVAALIISIVYLIGPRVGGMYDRAAEGLQEQETAGNLSVFDGLAGG